MYGPFPIVCRAHSGGRLLAEIYKQNLIQMGKVHPQTKDTSFFSIRGNFAVRKTIEFSSEYLNKNFNGQKKLQNLIRNCIDNYVTQEILDPTQPFGWKFAETLFILPVVFDLYPSTKAVHLIRDGRDVMLSRSEERFDYKLFNQAFNRAIVIGHKETPKFQGQIINKDIIDQNRNELELLHWEKVIDFGKKLRQYQNQYIEIKYEELCTAPEETLRTVFDFIEVKLLPKTIEWTKANANSDRIGKWKKLSPESLDKQTKHSKDTLLELNYN